MSRNYFWERERRLQKVSFVGFVTKGRKEQERGHDGPRETKEHPDSEGTPTPPLVPGTLS